MTVNKLLLLLIAVASMAFAPQDDFPVFEDVAGDVGVRLMNISGSGLSEYIVETGGSGGGFIDFDNDGDMDILIANGSTLDAYAEGGDPVVALYENQDQQFSDVTREAGLDDTGWGVGVCVADYDNDGHRDFYLTAYGPNRMYRNGGDGTFDEVSRAAGVDDSRWGTNCAFGDYDRDGDVDLYVANYVAFDQDTIPPRGCRFMGIDVMCGPQGLAGQSDVLYRNDGTGVFTDVTVEAGIEDPGLYGFGVVFSDFDNDGWPDIYVANDSGANFLFRNQHDGTFSEIGLISSAAFSLAGFAQAGMGVGVADYDADGYFDIVVTNFSQDTNTLYRNLGEMAFQDVTAIVGIGEPSRPYVGWGTGFVDFDNDGWQDLFVANGHVYREVDSLEDGSEYLQPNQVFRNVSGGHFEAMTRDLGGDLRIPKSTRGSAFGDLDNDGDIDVLATNLNDLPSLYRTESRNANHWIGFRLEGVTSNRDAIGARVEIDAAGRTQVREVRSGSSYLSHNDLRVHFGLGAAEAVDAIRIRWPNGNADEFDGVVGDRYLTIREGSGITTP